MSSPTLPRDRAFLLLHGWRHHQPPGHWLYWLTEQLRAAGEQVSYPQLPNPDHPELAGWSQVLRRELTAMGPGERVVVGHSLGCLLWLHHTQHSSTQSPVDRVLLVAPAGPSLLTRPELQSFGPAEFDKVLVRRASRQPTRLVCSDDDEVYCPEGADAAYGRPLGLDVELLPGTVHINPDSGFGPWPAVLAWARDGNHRFTSSTPGAAG